MLAEMWRVWEWDFHSMPFLMALLYSDFLFHHHGSLPELDSWFSLFPEKILVVLSGLPKLHLPLKVLNHIYKVLFVCKHPTGCAITSSSGPFCLISNIFTVSRDLCMAVLESHYSVHHRKRWGSYEANLAKPISVVWGKFTENRHKFMRVPIKITFTSKK